MILLSVNRYGAFEASKAHFHHSSYYSPGRQTLKWQEFLRPAYLGVLSSFYGGLTPLIQATGSVNW